MAEQENFVAAFLGKAESSCEHCYNVIIKEDSDENIINRIRTYAYYGCL